jgi:osmotically-inducible protein OsmY
MAWLQRLFGIEKPADAQVNPTPSSGDDSSTDEPSTTNAQIPPERLGLNGEYDQSGLAKRVALAFDEDGQFDDIDSIYVAQTGSTVVLKGDLPDQDTLDSLVEIAKGVTGANDVVTDQVTVG